MRSYYDSTLLRDGWIIDMLDEDSDKKFSKVKDAYDTSFCYIITYTKDSIGVDSVVHQVATGQADLEIYYPRKISITYAKKRPEPEYLKKFGLPKNVSTQISYIYLKDAILIK
jgi:hypothetical protein